MPSLVYRYCCCSIFYLQLKQTTEEYSAYKHEAECHRAELQDQIHELETSLMAATSQLKQKESAYDVLSADAAGLKTQVASLREEVTRVSSNLQQVTKELELKKSTLARETSSLQDAKVGGRGRGRVVLRCSQWDGLHTYLRTFA